ncbi:sulfite exporter TauE/SafE family protein [Methylobacterium sp. E-046]|uniref:sulfite exporter TauE/SafE family protein n=1 Tax=Methylobacterium sp. E-046 TaxID=2836576 RepID=UPI001FBBBE0B|nr:sulfite exporter TauE/SafE family protein [Methylobacterium sp. E-046]MCJ2101852.1 sulfite exporter TauE/SafE family protein [Methylobacterium sp. E-046]
MMPPFETDLLFVAALTFLLAGFVKGVVGLGLPTVAMGLLTLVLAPAQAASLLIVPSLVTNVWQLLAGPRFGTIAIRLWPMMTGIVVGTLAGTGFVRAGGAGWASISLGIALITYAGLGLTAVRFSVPDASERWLGPLVGAATGLVTGATGVFVIPAVPYLGALGLAKEDLIQALGLSFTVSTLALAAALTEAGTLHGMALGTSVAALVPALVGMILGGWVRSRVSEVIFRRCFFLGLLTLGTHLVVRSLL